MAWRPHLNRPVAVRSDQPCCPSPAPTSRLKALMLFLAARLQARAACSCRCCDTRRKALPAGCATSTPSICCACMYVCTAWQQLSASSWLICRGDRMQHAGCQRSTAKRVRHIILVADNQAASSSWQAAHAWACSTDAPESMQVTLLLFTRRRYRDVAGCAPAASAVMWWRPCTPPGGWPAACGTPRSSWPGCCPHWPPRHRSPAGGRQACQAHAAGRRIMHMLPALMASTCTLPACFYHHCYNVGSGLNSMGPAQRAHTTPRQHTPPTHPPTHPPTPTTYTRPLHSKGAWELHIAALAHTPYAGPSACPYLLQDALHGKVEQQAVLVCAGQLIQQLAPACLPDQVAQPPRGRAASKDITEAVAVKALLDHGLQRSRLSGQVPAAACLATAQMACQVRRDAPRWQQSAGQGGVGCAGAGGPVDAAASA
jgi:hypothetical protein